jgi:MSHA biogenesis protein MshM
LARIVGSYSNNNTLDLVENPFDWITDLRFFFSSPTRLIILNEVMRTIKSSSGRLLYFGERGIGKTILIKKLYSLLGGEDIIPIHISETYSIDGFIRKLLIGLKLFIGTEQPKNILAIQKWIRILYENDYRVVLLIDVGKVVSEEVNALMCELANLKYSKIPILHMVFFTSSYPMDEKWSVLSEIRIIKAVPRFNYEESVGLINFRCKVAGRRSPLFSNEGYRTIFEITDGNPGKIIRLCYPAMNFTALAGKETGGSEEVLKALESVKKPSIMDMWLPSFSQDSSCVCE